MYAFATCRTADRLLRDWLLAFLLLATGFVAQAQVQRQPLATSNTTAYTYVEQMPEMPDGGGMAGVVYAFQKQFHLSAREAEEATGGRVHLEFIVSETGNITNGRIIRSGGRIIDAAALRALKAMPRLLPSRQGGIPVKIKLVLPIACIKPQ